MNIISMVPKYTTQTMEIYNKAKTLHFFYRELVFELTENHHIHLKNLIKVCHTSQNDHYTGLDMKKKADTEEVLTWSLPNCAPQLMVSTAIKQ